MACLTCEEILEAESNIPTDKLSLLQQMLKRLCEMIAAIGDIVVEVDFPTTTCGEETALLVAQCAASGTASYTFDTVSAAGSTTAGLASLSIKNTGGSAGTIGGETVAAGEVLNFSASWNPVTKTFKYVPAVAYNATGTTFRIIEEGV